MEVILNQDVDRIGKAGSIVKVKDGFARNFLLPNGLAVPLNSSNLKKIEEDKARKAQVAEKNKKEAQELNNKLSSLSITIPVLAQDENKIFGSIGANEIALALKEEGLNIDKSKIILSEAIKNLGIYEVTVKLHPEISAQLKIWIVKK